MKSLRLLPYLGALLLLIAVASMVLAVLIAPKSLFPALLALAILAAVFGVLSVVFGLLLPKFERSALPSADILAAATAAGRLAPARVLSARATGVRVNMNWEYAVDVVVAPADRAAYRGIQYLRAPGRWTGPDGGAIITVIRVEADDPRVIMIKDAAGTDQSQRVPETAPEWAAS